MLTDRTWKLKYTPDDGNLVQLFYVPALQDAVRYDRLTGYFSAGALALAARGIEGLVGNDGHMRLVVGCTLEQPQIAAIERGERLRDAVERHLSAVPLTPLDAVAAGALESALLDDRARLSLGEGGGPVRGRPHADPERRNLS